MYTLHLKYYSGICVCMCVLRGGVRIEPQKPPASQSWQSVSCMQVQHNITTWCSQYSWSYISTKRKKKYMDTMQANRATDLLWSITFIIQHLYQQTSITTNWPGNCLIHSLCGPKDLWEQVSNTSGIRVFCFLIIHSLVWIIHKVSEACPASRFTQRWDMYNAQLLKYCMYSPYNWQLEQTSAEINTLQVYLQSASDVITFVWLSSNFIFCMSLEYTTKYLIRYSVYLLPVSALVFAIFR